MYKRQLRAEIARKEGVPPYIVFSDKSLVHMCVIRPVNKNEMLSVGGVGEFKFEKYGEQFLPVSYTHLCFYRAGSVDYEYLQ